MAPSHLRDSEKHHNVDIDVELLREQEIESPVLLPGRVECFIACRGSVHKTSVETVNEDTGRTFARKPGC